MPATTSRKPSASSTTSTTPRLVFLVAIVLLFCQTLKSTVELLIASFPQEEGGQLGENGNNDDDDDDDNDNDIDNIATTKTGSPPRPAAQARLTLEELTRDDNDSDTECPSPLVYMANKMVVTTTTTTTTTRATPRAKDSPWNFLHIPLVIHQSGRSRCVTPKMASFVQQWQEALPDHSYVFHDDAAVERLLSLEQHHPASARLVSQVARHCLLHPIVRHDIWRYLVLYNYGGIYLDLDTLPASNDDKKDFGASLSHSLSLSSVDKDTHHQNAVLSLSSLSKVGMHFMAATPRHVLFFYALQMALQEVTRYYTDVGTINPGILTGWHQAFRRAVLLLLRPKSQLGGDTLPQVEWETGVVYSGLDAHVWFVPPMVHHPALSKPQRREQYAAMNMTHYENYARARNQTCFSTLMHKEVQSV